MQSIGIRKGKQNPAHLRSKVGVFPYPKRNLLCQLQGPCGLLTTTTLTFAEGTEGTQSGSSILWAPRLESSALLPDIQKQRQRSLGDCNFDSSLALRDQPAGRLLIPRSPDACLTPSATWLPWLQRGNPMNRFLKMPSSLEKKKTRPKSLPFDKSMSPQPNGHKNSFFGVENNGYYLHLHHPHHRPHHHRHPHHHIPLISLS